MVFAVVGAVFAAGLSLAAQPAIATATHANVSRPASTEIPRRMVIVPLPEP
jgi:hypothetical protein